MDLTIPFSDISQAEEAAPGTVGAATPVLNLPKISNYALDEMVNRDFQDNIYPILTWTRNNRRGIEEEWHAIRRMEMQIHDGGQRYRGRSNSYLPVFSRIVQTRVAGVARGLFPSDEYMDVVDRNETTDPDGAKATKSYLQWEFETNGRVKSTIKPFLRQFDSYGCGVAKYIYKKELRSEGRGVKELDAVNAARMGAAFRKITIEGLHFSARNLFNWFVFPTTASNLEEATVVFEDIETPRAYITQMKNLKRWENVDQAYNAPRIPNSEQAKYENANNQNVPPPTGQLGDKEMGDVRTLTEVWTYMVLPNEAYLEGEDKGTPLPVKIVCADNVLLEVIRNPFYHQRPPYLYSAMNQAPGFIYGYGSGRMARMLQYLTNDFTNQTNDCGIYGLNPITKYNPGLLAGPLRPMAPGIAIPMTDTENGVRFDRPPVELVQFGVQMINLFMGMEQDLAGTPPQVSGIGGGKGSKTATGMQILQRNAMGPLQDVVEDLEQDIMVRLMFGTWLNAQQFRDEEVMAVIAGRPLKINMADIAGEWEMRWLASSQAVNNQQRNQAALQLLQVLVNPAMLQVLMQQGYVVDPSPLLNRIFSDGMGFRGFSEIVKRAQMAPPGLGAPAPGQMGGIMQEQGDRVRSAVEQAAGGSGDMAPGEGDDFMDIRNQADQLAGLMGGMQ